MTRVSGDLLIAQSVEEFSQTSTEADIESELVETTLEESATAEATEPTNREALKVPPRFGASFETSTAGFDEIIGIGAFVPITQSAGDDITFFEGNAQLIDFEPSFSLSIGHRDYDADDRLINGGYLGFDGRTTDSSTFYQLAAGYERIGKDWDLRLNGYLPVGDRTHTLQETEIDTGVQTASGFEGNQLTLSAVRERQRIFQQENSLGGFDLEVGTQLDDWYGGELMGYIGAYLLTGEDSSFGGQARLETTFESHFNAGLSYQYDDLFGSSVGFSIRASLPGRRFQSDGERAFQEENEVAIRLRDPIVRRPNVAINVRHEMELNLEEETGPLRNPEEEEDYRFIHVALEASTGAAGDGTYESPFGSVEEAIALIESDADTYSDGNTIVYVDGENAAADIPSFTIPERVQVLSQGPEQVIAGMTFPGFSDAATRLPFAAEQNFNVSSDDPNANGIAVTLPDSDDGVFPTIAGGTDNDLVTLSDNTVLSGFEIRGATDSGIAGDNIDNIELRNNLIEGSGGSGIALNDLGGSAIIFDSEINNSGDRGIWIENTLTDRPVEVTIAGFELDNNRVGMEFSAAASDTEFPSQRITIGPSTTANTSTGTPNDAASSNRIANSTDEGIIVRATGDSLFSTATQEFSLTEATLENNGSGTGAAGIQLVAEVGSHSQEFAVTDSTITNSGGNGIEVINGLPATGITETAAAQEIVVRDSTISGSGGSGIDISLADASAQELVIRGNQIINNAGDGIRSRAQNVAVQEWRTDSETGDAGISENTISDNGAQAIAILVEDVAVLPIVSITDNNLSDNAAGPDIEIASTSTPGGSAAACLIVADNVAPTGIQLTGADPILTGGTPSVLVQDLPALLADPNVTFLAIDFFGNSSPSSAPFQDEDNRCIP